MNMGQTTGGAFSRASSIEAPHRGRATTGRPRRWRGHGLFLLAACALVGLALLRRHSEAVVGPLVSTSASHFRFVASEQLAPMISFSPLEEIRGQTHYQARGREASAERWDTLTVGDAEADNFLFRVTLRSADPASAKSSLFVELAKQSAEIGAAIIRATSPQPYMTGRGPIEWAAVTLSGEKVERSCLGFRLIRTGDMDLSGLACGGRGRSLDAVGLGCLFDRISPTAAGLESGLGEMLGRDAARGVLCPRVVG